MWRYVKKKYITWWTDACKHGHSHAHTYTRALGERVKPCECILSGNTGSTETMQRLHMRAKQLWHTYKHTHTVILTCRDSTHTHALTFWTLRQMLIQSTGFCFHSAIWVSRAKHSWSVNVYRLSHEQSKNPKTSILFNTLAASIATTKI